LIRQILALTVKELKVLWHDWEALLLLFAMPIFFIVVMSWALGGVYEAGTRERPIRVVVLNQDAGGRAAEVMADLDRLEGFEWIEGGSLERVERLVRKGRVSMALRFRSGFSDAFGPQEGEAADASPGAVLIGDPGLNRQILSTVQGTVRGVIQRRLLLARLGPAAGALVPERGEGGPGVLGVRLLSRFDQGRRPTATEQHVPAYTIFGVFFIVLTLASGLLREKQEGTFRRILTAPMTRATLLVGKLVPYYLVNLVQIGLMFAVGVLLYGLRTGSVAALAVVSLALAASANGMGLLVASLGRTEAQVNGFSVLLAVTLSALGGMMVPSFVMPPGLRLLSRFTPHAWALEGYHDAMIRGLGVLDVLPESGVLLGFALLFFAFALWRFRFDR
jgi:ABC-2 type transport system permease protein